MVIIQVEKSSCGILTTSVRLGTIPMGMHLPASLVHIPGAHRNISLKARQVHNRTSSLNRHLQAPRHILLSIMPVSRYRLINSRLTLGSSSRGRLRIRILKILSPHTSNQIHMGKVQETYRLNQNGSPAHIHLYLILQSREVSHHSPTLTTHLR